MIRKLYLKFIVYSFLQFIKYSLNTPFRIKKHIFNIFIDQQHFINAKLIFIHTDKFISLSPVSFLFVLQQISDRVKLSSMEGLSNKYRTKLKSIEQFNQSLGRRGVDSRCIDSQTDKLDGSICKLEQVFSTFADMFQNFTKNIENMNKTQTQALQKILNTINTPFNDLTAINNKIAKSISNLATVSNISGGEAIRLSENQQNELKQKNDFEEMEMEDRFKLIKIEVPELVNKSYNTEARKNQIFKWLGEACKIIFSVSFQRLLNGSLNKKAVKVSCSENLLLRIIQFIKLNSLNDQEVQQINTFLKDTLLPYFQLKYPQSQSNQVNLRLSNKLTKIDNYLSNSNDLVFWSSTQFEYDETGEYNEEIMHVLNYIIGVPNKMTKIQKKEKKNARFGDIKSSKIDNQIEQKFEEVTLYTAFFKDMEELFKSVQVQQQVLRMKDGLSPQEFQLIKHEALKSKDPSKKQIYKEKVREYTKYLIGRKISESIDEYSSEQIKNQNIVIKNAQILRILNKWCDHLKKKFEKAEEIIENRDEPFRMQDGGQGYLSKTHRTLLSRLIKREEKNVNKFLERVMKNNYKFQASSAKNQLPQNLTWFSESESTIGMFTSRLFFNNENYIIGYLNTLIHCLLVATYDFNEVIALENRANLAKKTRDKLSLLLEKLCDNEIGVDEVLQFVNQKNKNKKKAFNYESVPQLVTFRLGDLMRCKCSSKQSEITALYKEIMRISETQPELWKVLRIKNRLSQGTRDILINLTYKKQAVIQIQLQVDEAKSNFIINSSSFKHYLYELSRAEFGPISEMSSIWMNDDHRSQFYKKQFLKLNVRKSIIGKSHDCFDKTNTQEFHGPLYKDEKFPFLCSLCDKLWTHSNFVNNHIYCNICHEQICGRCQIELDKTKIEPNFTAALKNDENQVFSLKYVKDEIPTFGASMLLFSKDTVVKKFRQVSYQNKKFLFEILPKQNTFSLMTQVSTKKQIKQFLEKNIVISLDPQTKPAQVSKKLSSLVQKQREQNFKIVQSYFLPQQFEQLRQLKRTSILQEKKRIQNSTFTIIQKCPDVLKINFSENLITDFDLIIERFPKIEIAVLAENQFVKIPSSIEKYKNCLQYLDLSNNDITELAPQLVELSMLTNLNLARNNIVKLPQNMQKMKSLKVLNIAYNNIQSLEPLPESIKSLDIQRNKFKEQIDFQNLINLINLNISYNKITKLKGVLNSEKIKFLDLSYNCLKNPEFVNMYNLENLNIEASEVETISISYDDVKESQLKYLNLSSNHLKDLTDQFYENIYKVEDLSLANNRQLRKISTGIYKLHYVQQLNLSAIRQFAKNMKKDKKRQENLEEEAILPPETHQYLNNLGYLYLSNNKLTQIPETLSKMPHLKQLDLSSNSIKKINKILAIQYLDLSFNKLKEFTPKDAEYLATVKGLILKNNKKLKHIDIKQIRKVMKNLQEIDCAENGTYSVQRGSNRSNSKRATQSDSDSIQSQVSQNQRVGQSRRRRRGSFQQKKQQQQPNSKKRKDSFQMKPIKQVKRQLQVDRQQK